MKRLTVLSIVAVSIVLIVPPIHANSEKDLLGFIAGEAQISTIVTQSLELSAAVGITTTSNGQICFAPPVGNLINAAVEFEAAAASLGFTTYRRHEDVDNIYITFSIYHKHNKVVRKINALCGSISRLE